MTGTLRLLLYRGAKDGNLIQIDIPVWTTVWFFYDSGKEWRKVDGFVANF